MLTLDIDFRNNVSSIGLWMALWKELKKQDPQDITSPPKVVLIQYRNKIHKKI